MKPSGSFGGMIGIDIPVFRFEAEYNYMIGKNMSLSVGMVNGYIKWLPTPIVKPYVGFGIGKVLGGKIRGDIDRAPDASIPFQGMIGLQIEIPATSLSVDVEGRAMYIESVYNMPIVGRDIGALQADLRVKIRYVF
jgi:opacity protein-like surface antigen